ncbi:MAG: RecQ family ATP-dependent DNA helicase, partial [Ignavibacteria bacterium]|nr:RecQ family ATP-dependent DNA helicase [Ignavibacteria bacterium]
MNHQEALKKYFGHENFRYGQDEIIESILNGENVLAVLPTGAGKSICYQIPALISDNFSIVISPLIALMKDQVDALNQKEHLASFINSTMTFTESEEVLQNIAYGKTKILYIAPERLTNITFAERLKKLNPCFLFIDEAHCISEWGHNFRPSYTRIKEFIDYIRIKKVSAFTATATPEVIKDITEQLGFKEPKIIVKGFERDNLHLNVLLTKKKNAKCLELISINKTPAIIYTSSRKKAEEISEYLNMHKIKCSYYHAGLNPIERKKVQEDFLKDVVPVIAATNAFGMGIDKKDIRLIIHYNTPGSIENYYQEIGRAGRDGADSQVYLLHDESDIRIQNYFLSQSHPDKEIILKIYNSICDYGKVAVGNISEKEIPLYLDFISAHTKKEISKGLLFSALRFLEAAGYLRVLSEYDRKENIQVLWNKERLKEFVKGSVSNSVKELILLLIREYGGEIFSKPIQISISQFSSKLGLNFYETNETLTVLTNMGIISYEEPLTKESVILTQPRAEVKNLKLDYKKILESYINLQKKIDKMVDYVFTDECRFRFILKYFGEKADNYSCNKCDRCLTDVRTTENVRKYISEVILKTFFESKKNLTEALLINILRGTAKSLDDPWISSFGVCRNYTRNELKRIIHYLIEQDFISEIKEKARVLRITEKGLKEIGNEVVITEEKTSEDYSENLALFNQLREVRSRISKKFNQNGLIICPDEIMREIANIKPKTKTEFLLIKGTSPRMFYKVGEDFLEIIRNFSVDSESQIKKEEQKNLPSNIQETYSLLKKGYSLKDIAQLRKTSEAVISMQIESIIEYDPQIEIEHLFN